MMAVAGVVCRSRFIVRNDILKGFRYSSLLNSVLSSNSQQYVHIRRLRHCRKFSLSATSNHGGKTVTEICKAEGINQGSSSSSSSSDSDTTDLDEDEVTIEYVRGLPQMTVPLPSRKEKCRFTLRPITNTVGDLLEMLRREDRGIDRVVTLAMDGTRIASSNTVETLLDEDFKLVINDNVYTVCAPNHERIGADELQRLNDVRNIVSQLYEALNVQQHQVQKERDLNMQLETLRQELLPLEEKRLEVESVAQRKVDYMGWVGLGLMSVQFGILARLTWWEYSWDIMEPVTYFVTYGTAMAAYAYYVVTKQEYILNDVRDRQHLLTIHKKAKKLGIDLTKYNQLKDQIRTIEVDLRKIKDPLKIHLPPKPASLGDLDATTTDLTSPLDANKTK